MFNFYDYVIFIVWIIILLVVIIDIFKGDGVI